MSLHECTKCGYATVAEDAHICPQCGTKDHAPMSDAELFAILAGIVAFIVGWIAYSIVGGLILAVVVMMFVVVVGSL